MVLWRSNAVGPLLHDSLSRVLRPGGAYVYTVLPLLFLFVIIHLRLGGGGILKPPPLLGRRRAQHTEGFR